MRKYRGRSAVLFTTTAAAVLLSAGTQPRAFAQGAGTGLWTSSGGSISNSRSTKNESKINAGNVGSLVQKWAFTPMGDVSATPTVQGNGVYVVDWGGYIHAVNALTGGGVWSKTITSYTGNPFGSTCRTSPAIGSNGNLIIGDQGDFNPLTPWAGFFPSSFIMGGDPTGKTASVMSIDKATGALKWRTIVDTHPWSMVTSSPIIYGGVVYVGVCSFEEALNLIAPLPTTFRGSLVALDEATGAILWKTYTCPVGYSGCAVWGSTPALDVARGTVYIGTGNNYSIPEAVEAQIAADPTHGGNYLANNDYVDAIVALDAKTGAIKWGRRMWKYGADTWTVARGFVPTAFDPAQGPDYDFGSGPNLFTVTVNGKKRDLVGAGEKSGEYHALDPDTGALVWTTQVGPGGTSGGIQWGSAVDGNRAYCAISNSLNKPTGLTPEKNGGLWAGLDAATGTILWRTADPITRTTDGLGGHDWGMVTATNGVVFAGSCGVPPLYDNPFAPTVLYQPGVPGGMFALDAATGAILWSRPTDNSVVCGPAVANGMVYWGTGYSRFGGGFGVTGGTPKVYAFSLP